MSVLSDYSINRAQAGGQIDVFPIRSEALQPASVDLSLGGRMLRYPPARGLKREDWIVDPENPPAMEEWPDFEGRWILAPGAFALGSTFESVALSASFAAQVDGKSSLGRLGLFVHTTAGWIDPGFHGHITLEFYNASPRPILLRQGMFIAQLVVHSLTTTVAQPYAGQYQGALGVESSKGVRLASA